eukprot:834366-Pyramimonas_sp.AAC.1
MVLDRPHRDNHTWRLNNMPEVDPLRPDNSRLLEKKNTGAEWPGDDAGALPNSLVFDAHNQWLEREAACERRCCEAGPTQRQTSGAPQDAGTASK